MRDLAATSRIVPSSTRSSSREVGKRPWRCELPRSNRPLGPQPCTVRHGGSSVRDRDEGEYLAWKRFGSGKPQQSAAIMSGASLAERPERQAAVDRSRCSRLLSSGSQVRVLPGAFPGGRFASGMSAIAAADGHVANDAVEASWKRGGFTTPGRQLFRHLDGVAPCSDLDRSGGPNQVTIGGRFSAIKPAAADRHRARPR